MDYQKIYNQLIERGQRRNVLKGYVEKHHIIPVAYNGSDEPSNIVELTAREYFIAHLLLSKIYGGKMVHALFMMTTRNGYTNRVYGTLREQFSILLSQNTERSRKISESLKGYKKSEEHIANWINSRKRNKSFIHTQEQDEKISRALSGEGNPMYGKTHTPDAKQKIIEANRQKVVCPHCGKNGGIAIMKRWHFDRCKGKVL